VKRLLRLDNESVRPVKWEVITEAELQQQAKPAQGAASNGAPVAAEEESNTAVDERELFGDTLSDTDEEEGGGGGGEGSSTGATTTPSKARQDVESEGDSNMFEGSSSAIPAPSAAEASSSVTASATVPASGGASSENPPVTQFNSSMFPQTSAATIASSSYQHLERLKSEVTSLRIRKEELEKNVANCDNPALRQRFQQSLAEVEMELGQKEEEMESLSMLGMS